MNGLLAQLKDHRIRMDRPYRMIGEVCGGLADMGSAY